MFLIFPPPLNQLNLPVLPVTHLVNFVITNIYTSTKSQFQACPSDNLLLLHLTFSRTLSPTVFSATRPLVSPLTLSAIFPMPSFHPFSALYPARVHVSSLNSLLHSPLTLLPFPQSYAWGRIQTLVNLICLLLPRLYWNSWLWLV